VPESTTIDACRSCGHTALETFLDLGNLPVADGLIRPGQLENPDPRYPLVLALCPHCALVQILETVAPDLLFCNDYPYYSSVSDYWLDHCRRHAETLIRQRGLDGSSLVVEVASNDGYMLRNFAAAGIPVLGIDPATGPAGIARRAGIETLDAFFSEALARGLRDEHGAADLVLANNILAHVADSRDLVAGLRTMIGGHGLISIEVPYVRDLIDHGEFDTIYHQHLCYFSLSSIINLLATADLTVLDVSRLPSHGGSLRVYAGIGGQPSGAVSSLLAEENELGLNRLEYHTAFSARVRSIRDDLNALLAGIKEEGASIAGYGAAAKACTLLNFCGIDGSTIDFIVDRNPHKHGLFMPGVRLPIFGPERLLAEQPDYALLLCWNLADEILEQQREYRARGGRFIVPLPQLRIL
jgi:hypothetical protein